ncbi:hypothetical protein LTR95_019397, partial [Oleoguttula sp. CCFEE 5521]
MASEGMAGIDVDALRRPTTVNANDFWFCPKSQWEILEAEASNLFVSQEDRQSAEKQLCRIHDVGLIMETTSGIDVQYGCKRCTEAGVRCRVWKDERRKGCAYCLVNGTECTATAAAASATSSNLDSASRAKPPPRNPTAVSPSTNHFRDLEIAIFGRPRDARSTPPSSDAEAEAEAELRSFVKRQPAKKPVTKAK